jgi:lipopolysaccharide export system protein LptA
VRLMGSAVGLSLFLAGVPGHYAAAQLLSPSADNLPLNVQADSGIEWQQDQKLYIARGNAVATRGPAEVHADTLIAHYREIKGGGDTGNTGGNTEIYRVEAEGNVTMIREGSTIVGDHAVYDLDQALMVVTGKALKLTTATDVVTARDTLEWYDQKQVAVGRGDAVATRNGKTIKADILTAYVVKTKPAGAKTPAHAGKAPPPQSGKPSPTPAAATPATPEAMESKISRVDAQGHVVVTNALDTGRGDYGVYNADTGICTLVDNVVIARGKDVIKGQKGVMDLNKNVSRMLPVGEAAAGPPQRVQGLFIRDDQNKGIGLPGATSGHKPASAADKKP